MSKRRNTNRNSNSALKRFFRKPIVMMTCVALAVTMVLGTLGTITEGFNDWSGDTMKNGISTIHFNQNNLFFDVIEDKTLADTNNGKAVAKNGKITLNYDIADTDNNAVTVAETIEFATVNLKEGTYTLSAMNKADWKTCYVVGTYTLDGTTHTWYADYESISSFNNADTAHARTLELAEDVEVIFSIRVCEGAKLDNVKVTPVLVEGENEGNYYAGLLGLIG